MTVYAHVINGVLQSIGPLPSSARRLDTNQEVSGAELLERLPAAGYFPLDTDPATITSDPDKRDVLAAALVEASGRLSRRDAFLATFVTAARTALETNLGIRETNAELLLKLDVFINGTAPAGTAVQQLAWLYDQTRDLARAVRMSVLEVNVLTRESDGLIHLFGNVLPELDDLLDVN